MRSRYRDHLNAMLLLLLSLLFLSSSFALFRGKVFVRVQCFQHNSSLLLDGTTPCDPNSPCDPAFLFCFYNTSNEATCNLKRVVFDFKDSSRLGVCAGKLTPNLPARLVVPMTTAEPDLSLQLSISDVDRGGIFERQRLIDELTFRLLPAGLPSVPDGRLPTSRQFADVKPDGRTFKGETPPRVRLQAVVQCAKGRFGPSCEVACEPTDQFSCFTNGSRQCRVGWSGGNCSERDFCSERPCKPWAVCRPTPGGFLCSCDGASGPQCLRGGDPCLNNRCLNNATCLSVSGRPICVCAAGFRGRFCEQRDPCHPNPCAHVGACTPEKDGFRCSCPPLFRGPLCNQSVTRSRKEVPKRKEKSNSGPFSMALLLLIILISVLVIAFMAMGARCYWLHWHQRDRQEKFPSLTTLSAQRVSSTSLSVYDESRVTVETRLSNEEGVYEVPGQLYSVREEEEEEEEGEGVFRPNTDLHLSAQNGTVRFVRT